MAKKWYFHTTCIHSDGKSITDMQGVAKDITYRTLRKHLGDELTGQEKILGYDTGYERGGLRMSNDWAVQFKSSTYQGKPCLYFAHSHIEYIFLQEP